MDEEIQWQTAEQTKESEKKKKTNRKKGRMKYDRNGIYTNTNSNNNPHKLCQIEFSKSFTFYIFFSILQQLLMLMVLDFSINIKVCFFHFSYLQS